MTLKIYQFARPPRLLSLWTRVSLRLDVYMVCLRTFRAECGDILYPYIFCLHYQYIATEALSVLAAERWALRLLRVNRTWPSRAAYSRSCWSATLASNPAHTPWFSFLSLVTYTFLIGSFMFSRFGVRMCPNSLTTALAGYTTCRPSSRSFSCVALSITLANSAHCSVLCVIVVICPVCVGTHMRLRHTGTWQDPADYLHGQYL